MMKARKNRSAEELKEAAAHVAYEIETMLFAADHLEWGHSSPAVHPTGKEQDVFLEAFLLHYRNLRAFLCPSLQKVEEDDVLATDFLGENAPLDQADASVLGRDKVRIDKSLAHISYARLRYAQKGDTLWPVPEMRNKMLAALDTFIHRLPANKEAWFLNSGPLRDALAAFSTTRTGPVPETAFTSTVVKTDIIPGSPDGSRQEIRREITNANEDPENH